MHVHKIQGCHSYPNFQPFHIGDRADRLYGGYTETMLGMHIINTTRSWKSNAIGLHTYITPIDVTCFK